MWKKGGRRSRYPGKNKSPQMKRMNSEINELSWLDKKAKKDQESSVQKQEDQSRSFFGIGHRPIDKINQYIHESLAHWSQPVFPIKVSDPPKAASEEKRSSQPQLQPTNQVVQQYGLEMFLMQSNMDQAEVKIAFEQPFEDENYVLVATTNQPSCYAVVKSKQQTGAEIEVVRNWYSSQPGGLGVVNWIAIGRVKD